MAIDRGKHVLGRDRRLRRILAACVRSADHLTHAQTAAGDKGAVRIRPMVAADRVVRRLRPHVQYGDRLCVPPSGCHPPRGGLQHQDPRRGLPRCCRARGAPRPVQQASPSLTRQLIPPPARRTNACGRRRGSAVSRRATWARARSAPTAPPADPRSPAAPPHSAHTLQLRRGSARR